MAQSRNEKLLEALLNGETADIVPQSRNEAYLKAMVEGTTEVAEPHSRIEAYLYALAKNGAFGTGSDIPQEDIDAAFAALTAKGVTVPEGATSADLDELILSITAALQSKAVTPTKAAQSVTPDNGYDGLSSVTVGAIPADYVTTTDATATAENIAKDKTAYVNGQKITGTLTAAEVESVKAFVDDLPEDLTVDYIHKRIVPVLGEFESTCAYTSTESTLSMSLPSTSGDTFVAVFAMRNVSTIPTTPSGWTFYGQYDPHSDDTATYKQTMFIYTQKVDNSSGVTITLSHENDIDRFYGMLINIRDSSVGSSSLTHEKLTYIPENDLPPYRVACTASYQHALFLLTSPSSTANRVFNGFLSDDVSFSSSFYYDDGYERNSRLSYYYRSWDDEYSSSDVMFRRQSYHSDFVTICQLEIIPGTASAWSVKETCPNGTKWFSLSSKKSIRYTDIVYFKNMWVAGTAEDGLYYSPNGVEWKSSNITSGGFIGLACGAGLLVGVKKDGTICYSTDGMSLSESNIVGASDTSISHASTVFADSIWVCTVGANSYYSTDGKSWILADTHSSSITGVEYADGIFVRRGLTSGLSYSSDGISWTQSNVTSGQFLKPVLCVDGLWVAMGTSGNNVYYSTDGMTWTTSNLNNYPYFSGLAHINGRWLCAGDTGLYYSTDGMTWTETQYSYYDCFAGNPYGLYSANGICILTTRNEAYVYYSYDGITWSQASVQGGYINRDSGSSIIDICSCNGMWYMSEYVDTTTRILHYSPTWHHQ